MKTKNLIIFIIIFLINSIIYGSGNVVVDNFPTGIAGWSGSGWNGTGSVLDETEYVYDGEHSLKTYYKITGAWGNYASLKIFNPSENWNSYKYMIFYVRSNPIDIDTYDEFQVLIYNPDSDSNATNDEVWYWSDKEILETSFFKQIKLKLDSKTNGGDFMDVDWDDDRYTNNFNLTAVTQITFMVSGGLTAKGEGYFWVDNIFITSNETFENATLISPEHTTGLAKNTTVKIKIGYNMTNIVCQLVDASNNYYKYELSDSIVSYSDDVLTVSFTNLKNGRNIIAVDAVNKNTGVPLNQFVKDLYVSDYYVIDNFETSDLTELNTSAFSGSTAVILSSDIHNTEYGGTKSVKLIYSSSAAWKSSGVRISFDEPMDFSDFSVLRLYVKGDVANTGRINVAFYDNDNNKLDLNYNEDDYCAWTGSDEIEKNFWVKIDIPLNSSSFIDGNTPANNSGYPSGDHIVEFNEIESLDIYIDSPYAGCSGTLYLDDIMLLKHGYEFVSENYSTDNNSVVNKVEISDFSSVYDINSGDYNVKINVPDNSTVKYKIIGINGESIVSSGELSASGDTVIRWNGKSSGKTVKPGIYFIRIDVENTDSNFKKSVIKRFYIIK